MPQNSSMTVLDENTHAYGLFFTPSTEQQRELLAAIKMIRFVVTADLCVAERDGRLELLMTLQGMASYSERITAKRQVEGVLVRFGRNTQ
jgi:hypothetical protein